MKYLLKYEVVKQKLADQIMKTGHENRMKLYALDELLEVAYDLDVKTVILDEKEALMLLGVFS